MSKVLRKQKRVRQKKSLARQGSHLARSPIFWRYAILLFLIFGAWYALAPFLEVQEITVSGTTALSPEEVREQAHSSFPKGILFGRSYSILLADTAKVERELLAYSPIVEEVVVARNLKDRALEVSLKERKQEALFCQEECLSVDSEGIAFRKAESQDDPVIILSEGRSIRLGDSVLAEEHLKPLLQFSSYLENSPFFQAERLQISSLQMLLPQKAMAVSSEGWVVYFNPAGDLEWQAEKLLVVLKNKVTPGKRKALEYIEVRFGDQAYIK